MSYAESAAVPVYQPAEWSEDGKTLLNPEAPVKWSAPAPPPAVGAHIVVTMNGVGAAVVRGYFTQDGWLGLVIEVLTPPDWHKRQNKGATRGHVFGPEFLPLPDFAAALAYRDKLDSAASDASAALRALPGVGGGSHGLTPDAVKASEAFRMAKARYDGAADRLKRFNSWFTVHHKAELRAHYRARR